MPEFETPDAFEAAFRAAVEQVRPGTEVTRVSRTLVAVKLRADLRGRRFIDAFFNATNLRTDLSVIDGTERLFGYDNLGGWHRHPTGSPDAHEPCDKPDLTDFLREASELP